MIKSNLRSKVYFIYHDDIIRSIDEGVGSVSNRFLWGQGFNSPHSILFCPINLILIFFIIFIYIKSPIQNAKTQI